MSTPDKIKSRPSRTHSLAREGLAVIVWLTAGVLFTALVAPGQLHDVVSAFEAFGGMVTALAGVGVGGMTLRDAYTGGLTSSSADLVLESQRIAAAAPEPVIPAA